MLFDDDFVMGHVPGAQDLGGFNDAFGGPGRFDAGEIVVVGRVPGSLYIDDFSAGQTALEHILPMIEAQNAISPVGADEQGPAASAQSDDLGQLTLAGLNVQDDSPAAIILPTFESPLADFGADFGHDVFARPLLDLTPVTPIDPVAPAADAGDLPFTLIGGQAYQSLSFLIIDTPYAVEDSHLSPTLRPSVDALLGLTDADNGDVWVLPAQGHRSWLLN
ncbi:MAG: hypothetical protein GC145_09115 [Caulobacter sp.]|nr:hypothetical protein [Caulobacter sp.]